MPVYIVARIDIHDRSGYASYEAGFGEIFARYDGRILSVEEAPEVLEGQWDTTRTVVIEFPSTDEAHAWFDSVDYQALAKHRKAASVGNIVLLQGFTPA